jgi:hypothetical protein
VRISAVGRTALENRVRVQAQVQWESSNRPSLEIYAESPPSHGAELSADPNAFLVAAYLPAWHYGEEVVQIDGPVCPVLHDNLKAAAALLAEWYPEFGSPPSVCPARWEVQDPRGRGALMFLSGGIDSLAALRHNKVTVRNGHPLSVDSIATVDVIVEPGLSPQGTDAQARAREALGARVAADVGVAMIPLRTNLLELDGDGYFYTYKWHGAVFASLAMLLAGSHRTAYLAASHEPGTTGPFGSHPFLDPLYSSSYFEFRQAGGSMSRTEKTQLVAEWATGSENILVCQSDQPGTANCGECEKCIRTMVTLEGMGALVGCRSFRDKRLDPELIGTLLEYDMIEFDSQARRYGTLASMVRGRGRLELADALDDVVSGYFARSAAARDRLSPLLRQFERSGRIAVVDGRRFGPRIAGIDAHVWGPPADGVTAVRELEALQSAGFRYVVIQPVAAWFLEAYVPLRSLLTESNRIEAPGTDAIAYDLSRPVE